MPDEFVYEINEASYSYLGRFSALKRIDLAVRRGESIALLGANGSGKSTLLLMLAGLIFPDAGSVRFYGKPLKEDSFIDPSFQKCFRTCVGVVFQNSDIQLFNSSVADELLFGLVQLGLPGKDIDARIEKYTALMEIAHLKDRHPQALSIGEKKRVAIASVLAMEPEVILLDEPTSGLDPKTSRHLIDTILRLGRERKTVITSTQDIHMVSDISERIIVMGEDRTIAKDGRAEDVLADQEFLIKHNLVHIHSHKHKDIIHTHSHEHPSHEHPHGI